MEFLEQTVLGDYEHFAQVGEQYHADADTFQQIMQQTKEAVDALEQHIGEISSTVSEINSMVEQSTDGISGIAEKSGSTPEPCNRGLRQAAGVHTVRQCDPGFCRAVSFGLIIVRR